MSKIQFTDGTYLTIQTPDIVIEDIGSILIPNAVLGYYDPRDGKVYGESKTDLDGNVWNISMSSNIFSLSAGTRRISISQYDIPVRVSYNPARTTEEFYLGTYRSSITSLSKSLFSTKPSLSTGTYCFFIDTYNSETTIEEIYAEALANPSVYHLYIVQVISGSTPPFSLRMSQVINRRDMFQYDYYSYLGTDFPISSFSKSFVDEPFVPQPEPIPNPFNPYPPSQQGTLPPGTFDDTSDPIPDSSLPTLSAANTGFTRIYNPTLAQVQSLAEYLWTTPDIIDTIWNHIKQFFEDPMQAIIGFNLVPCTVPDAGSKEFALMFINTGVTMNVAANQFVDVECGSVELKRYYGSALDQSPYTKVSCFLPFIGVVSLNTDEVMGTTLSVRYRIDIVSGSCVAKILVDNNALYQYSGHCAINIPFSSADFSSYVSAAISVAKLTIGYGVAGALDMLGTTSDPASQTSTTSTLTTTETNTVRNPTTGRQITAGTKTTTQVLEEQKDTFTTRASYDGLTPANIANTVGQIMGSKPHIEHSGSFNGNTGYLGVRRPYLIIERPNMCLPENYQSLNGFPSMITMPLGECKGYTRVQQVQLTGMQGASINEQSEIQSFLKSGVIF